MKRLALLFALVLALVPAAQAATPQTNLSDIEDEVMCPICGTALNLSQSPQADRERTFIRGQIAQGKTKQQIKDELVAQYGPQVLSVPEKSGFDLAAWLVPILALALAAVAIAVGLRRWRRRAAPPSDSQPAARTKEDTDRLDADMAKYDL
jgi:cytochrome c-type biogenesis protein CcmH